MLAYLFAPAFTFRLPLDVVVSNVCPTLTYGQVDGYNGGAVNIVDWDFVVDNGEAEVTNTQKPVDGFELGQLILAHGKFQARLVTIRESTQESPIF